MATSDISFVELSSNGLNSGAYPEIRFGGAKRSVMQRDFLPLKFEKICKVNKILRIFPLFLFSISIFGVAFAEYAAPLSSHH